MHSVAGGCLISAFAIELRRYALVRSSVATWMGKGGKSQEAMFICIVRRVIEAVAGAVAGATFAMISVCRTQRLMNKVNLRG